MAVAFVSMIPGENPGSLVTPGVFSGHTELNPQAEGFADLHAGVENREFIVGLPVQDLLSIPLVHVRAPLCSVDSVSCWLCGLWAG